MRFQPANDTTPFLPDIIELDVDDS